MVEHMTKPNTDDKLDDASSAIEVQKALAEFRKHQPAADAKTALELMRLSNEVRRQTATKLLTGGAYYRLA